MEPSQIQSGIIVRVANKHINRYRNRIRQAEQGSTNVNKAECQKYSHIWEQVRLVKGVWDQIEPAGRNEIRDALAGGEFDGLILS